MRSLIALVPVCLFAAASCGVAEMTTSPPIDNNDGTDFGPSYGHVPTCTPSCSTQADCGTPGDPLYDPSHYVCKAGACVWQGCKSASECKTEAHGGNFICEGSADTPTPSCIPACRKPADCVAPGNTEALGDATHFACKAGACVWQGCRSASECASSLHTSKVACEQPPGSSTKTCVPTCSKASDCATSQGGILTDATHFTCNAGVCQWLGCKSTTECAQTLQSSRYVCE